MHNLEKYKLDTCPDSVYYIPDFINKEEESFLLNKVENAPRPKWVCLKNRRLQNWGGVPQLKGMVPEPIPDWLDSYCSKLAALDLFDSFKPNHILVNEYQPGQGIMPHEDGALYFPTVSTISLGSYTYLDFYRPISQTENIDNESNNSSSLTDRYMFSLILEPCSLLILKDDMYKVYLHGIKETKEDLFITNTIANYENLNSFKDVLPSTILKRETRVSLTIRYVPKVLKINMSSLLFNNKRL